MLVLSNDDVQQVLQMSDGFAEGQGDIEPLKETPPNR